MRRLSGILKPSINYGARCVLLVMNRRKFLQNVTASALTAGVFSPFPEIFQAHAAEPASPAPWIDPDLARDWQVKWEKHILDEARDRSCDREMGEEIGWIISPMLNGFYYGYLATKDTKWIELLIDWSDALIRRGKPDPDGFIGWPKGDGGGNDSKEYTSDSLLGEAMALRPIVLMSVEILASKELYARYGRKAREYMKLSGQTFKKWEARACWREVKDGGLWVVPAFGTDLKTGTWSAGHESRETTGFSNPDNKQNHIARWHAAMYIATKLPIYRERCAKWWRLMKSRMKLRDNDKYYVWNYWEPGGPWDYKPDGSPRHWVGVHPNGGYYQIDLEGIVNAFEMTLSFGRDDIDRLIATNRDFMWNHEVKGAKFQRIDGGEVDARWKNSPGVLWTALVPHDQTLRKIFIENHNPASWGGLGATPWFLALDRARQGKA
jgi:hypothetical protein